MLATGRKQSFNQLKCMPLPAPSQAHGSPNPNHPLKPGVFFDSRLLELSPKINRVDLAPIFIPTARLNNAALRKDLVRNTLNTNSDFLAQLLPHRRLPFPVNEDLLKKLSAPIGTNAPIWNERKSCFRQPPKDFGEATVCEWLNDIGATMGLV